MKLTTAMNATSAALALYVASGLVVAQERPIYNVATEQTLGGQVYKYMEQVRGLNRSGTVVRIDTNVCISACTLFLTATDVCIGTRTVFGFHGPSSYVFGVTGIPMRNLPTDQSRRNIDLAISRMASAYERRWTGLGTWFLNGPANKFGYGMTSVNGKELNRAFGIPLCSQDGE